MVGLILAWTLGIAGVKEEPPEKLIVGEAAGYSVRIIRINLNDPRVHINVGVATGFPFGVNPFHQLVERTKPVAAINGAYASKTDFRPIGDIVIKGKLVYSGLMGTALAITKDKQVMIRRVRWGHAEDWSAYETVLSCGPALVLNGQVDVLPAFEKFSDPHVMGSTRRMGVGVTPDNHLLFVNTLSSVNFYQFGKIMLALGCRDAMNLDAGASLGLYYRGKYLITPERHITNILMLHVGDKEPGINALFPQSGGNGGGGKVNSTPPPRDPGNSVAKNAVLVELCADSMGKASSYCPERIKRKVPTNKIPRPCPFHKIPAGERG